MNPTLLSEIGVEPGQTLATIRDSTALPLADNMHALDSKQLSPSHDGSL
jgi:hypothetical protein